MTSRLDGSAIRGTLKSCWQGLILCCTLLAVTAGNAADPVLLTVNSRQPGLQISSNALGLSYETRLLLPDTNGIHYFRPDNTPLVNAFKTLGVTSLRVGGNSVDAPEIAVPALEDVTALFEFARAAGVKVIYSVRLQDGDPRSATQIARHIHSHFAGMLDCFAIGNEPNYYKEYNVYQPRWTAIRDAILEGFPDAAFCGPDQNPSPVLSRQMVHDFGAPRGRLVLITQHSYPFGCSYKNPGTKDVEKLIPIDAAAACEKMLSPGAWTVYEEIRKGMADAVAGTPVAFRLTEVNSYWFSGLKGASDRYAAALWAVDYLHWWTANGSQGLNFHTGDRTGGAISLPCRYAAFVSDAGGYAMRPLAYGMKLFDLGGHGTHLPVTLSSNQNLVAYATQTGDKTVAVTLINKSHGAGASNTVVQIKLDSPLASSQVQAVFLSAPDGDIAAETGVTLGGAAIEKDGAWNGKWTTLPASSVSDSAITVTVPAASAAVIKFK